MRFSFLNNFFSFSGRRALGIDIGTTTIKVVELLKDKFNRFSLANYGLLENYGHLERINDAFQTSGLKLMEGEVANSIGLLLKKGGFKAKDVGMSIPVYSAFLSTLDFPPMSQEELARAVPFRAKQFVPLPLEEVYLDWFEVSPSKEEVTYRNLDRKLIFLVAVPKEVVERYKRITELVGLNLVALELESLVEGRAILDLKKEKDPILVLDIGSRVTNLIVFDNGFLRASRYFDLASGDLTQVISSGMKIDIWRAEKLKREKGLSKEGGYIELASLILPTLDVILKEARNLIIAYKEKTGREISKLILAGATANLRGLVDYVSTQFPNLEVKKADAFGRIKYSPELEPLVRIITPFFGPSVGIAMKALTD